MKLRVATLLAASLCLGLSSGCIVHQKKPHGHRNQAVKSKKRDCHPSQYWDGHKCRHKGKGKGARKHDD